MAKKITNRMYQLYELEDTIEHAIDSLKVVIDQQEKLAELVEKSEYKEEMSDFTKGTREQNKSYLKRIEDYNEKLCKIKWIIELYEKKDEQSEFVVKLVTNLIEALNLSTDPNQVQA